MCYLCGDKYIGIQFSSCSKFLIPQGLFIAAKWYRRKGPLCHGPGLYQPFIHTKLSLFPLASFFLSLAQPMLTYSWNLSFGIDIRYIRRRNPLCKSRKLVFK